MLTAVIPIAVLLFVALCTKIPKIGGNINVALIIGGLLALLLGGIYNPVGWAMAWFDGLNRIAWVMCLSLFGSLYSESQVKLGTVETILTSLEARFKNNPKMLVISVVLVLVLAGSLLGDAIAAGTVVGVLIVANLARLGLSGPKISAIIVMGAVMGSIMPPMSLSLALSATLCNTPADPVYRLGYLSVGICVFLVCAYIWVFLLRDIKKIEIKIDRTAFQILRAGWVTLIPLFGLILVVVFRTIPSENPLHFDLMLTALNAIPVGGGQSLYTFLSGVPIIRGVVDGIVMCIIFALLVSFCFPKVHRQVGTVFKTGLKNVKRTLIIQACCGFMLGAFYNAGQVEAVQTFAQQLDANVLKIGGIVCITIVGMLTGSTMTTNNLITSSFGPALIASGVQPTRAALACAHLCSGGQGFPPADLTTFAVVGIVGGALDEDINPIESMFYSAPMCVIMMLAGAVFMFI